jgi:UDP-N-acetylglucosamine diphosphorylase/glucosamine-1-phosphate N-acetyltransferase
MLAAYLFDDGLPELSPLTDMRACFDIRTGALTTLERLSAALRLHIVGLRVPAPLAALTSKRHSAPVNVPVAPGGPLLLINGRCALPHPQIAGLQPGQALVEDGANQLIAAMLAPAAAQTFLDTGSLPNCTTQRLPAPSLLSRPWHVRRFRDDALKIDLPLLEESDPGALTSTQELSPSRRYEPQPGVLHLGGNAVIHPDAKVYPDATLDSEHGTIHIAAHAVIRPGAILIGPCYVGQHSTVLERATIRAGTCIGPWCKVNGEVGGTIFQGYSNKAHDGYVGDSYLGEWVNLGAGTTTSNLLNTYGEIIARALPTGPNERTGETFLGSIIGDHVKTAICTRIMTGTVLHTGCMFATTAPVSGCVGAFTWATDSGTRRYRLDKFLEVARAAMGRRKVEPSTPYLDRLRQLHVAATGGER